jgi:hypothetical protein
MNGSLISGGITLTTALLIGIAVIFFLLLLIFAALIYFRQDPVPAAVTYIFRVILALMGGGFGSILGGELALNFSANAVTGQATGGLGLAVLLYLVNPPHFVEQIAPHQGGPPPAPPAPPPARRRERPANTRRIG